MPPATVQKMARVNVDPDAWTTLRLEALRRHLSLADYLGQLVAREAHRITRRASDRASSLAAPQPPAGNHATSSPGKGERGATFPPVKGAGGRHERSAPPDGGRERSAPPWEQ